VKIAAPKSSSPVKEAAHKKEALSREHILRVALKLIDRHGAAAFSLRELASELGVYPTAIYWHVANRNELIAGATALALSSVSAQLPQGTWQARLRYLFTRFRAALRRHPNLAPIIGSQLLSNSPIDLAMVDHIIGALEDAGFSGSGLIEAFNVVVAAMCSFATLELASAPAHDSAAWAKAQRQRLRQIPSSQYPAVARHISAMQNNAFILRWTSGTRRPLTTSFEAWIDVVISGLQARSTQQS
jgi:TetR/AcrR family tetracycline transcriptional repressor